MNGLDWKPSCIFQILMENTKYLPEEPHNFTLSSVLAERKPRLIERVVINYSAGDETPESALAWFRCYDQYELCNFSLSCLAIKTLVHPDLRYEVVVQHNHEPLFKKIPGNIYLMMVLEV